MWNPIENDVLENKQVGAKNVYDWEAQSDQVFEHQSYGGHIENGWWKVTFLDLIKGLIC